MLEVAVFIIHNILLPNWGVYEPLARQCLSHCSACFRDPHYPDDYIFEAKLFPSVTMPLWTLKGRGVLGPYQPQIGFSQREGPHRSYSTPQPASRMIRWAWKRGLFFFIVGYCSIGISACHGYWTRLFLQTIKKNKKMKGRVYFRQKVISTPPPPPNYVCPSPWS